MKMKRIISQGHEAMLNFLIEAVHSHTNRIRVKLVICSNTILDNSMVDTHNKPMTWADLNPAS